MKVLTSLYGKLGVLALLLASFALQSYDGSQILKLEEDGPVIFVDNDTYDYGTLDKGADGSREVTITNTGNETLIISKCKGSCGCTVPLCPVEPVLPGKTAVITITYDTNRIGPFSKKVTITSNAINSNTATGLGYELYIRGTIKAKTIGEAPVQRGPIQNK